MAYISRFGHRHAGTKPVIWGTDAIHGQGNAYGDTLFPHNIDSGAAHDSAFIGVIVQAPLARVSLSVECNDLCAGVVDLGRLIGKWGLQSRHTVNIALACFGLKNADYANVNVPFGIFASKPCAAAFANIQIVTSTARAADTLTCPNVGANSKYGGSISWPQSRT